MIGADESPRDLARWAVDHAQDVPRDAAETARGVLALDVDVETRALAYWAAGLAARELGDLDAARPFLGEAVTTAERAGLRRLGAEIRSSLSLTLAYAGEVDAALRQAARASRHLDGTAWARNEAQRALILQRLGRFEAALHGYDRALAGMNGLGDPLGEARLLLNRGVLHGYRLRFAEGIGDLEEAARLAGELGQTLLLASVTHNLGFLEGRRGNAPAALARLDEATSLYETAGNPAGHLVMLRIDQVEVLRSVGLTDSARRVAGDLLAAITESPNTFDNAEMYLIAARCALDAGEPGEAVELARRAEGAFSSRRRSTWADVSRLIALRAEGVMPDRVPSVLSRQSAGLGGRLARVGLVAEAMEARLWAGRLAEEASETRRAGAAYRRIVATAPVTAFDAALVGEAAARLALLSGDEAAAEQAVREGLDAVARGLMTLGGTEMRARAADQALELTGIAIATALAHQDPVATLAAVDARRSIAARLPPARPPDDPRYGGLFGELRDVVARLETPDESAEERERLVERLGRLESEIVRLERRRQGLPVGPVSPARLGGLFDRLGRRTLVSFFRDGSRLRAVAASSSGARLVGAGSVDEVRREARSLIFDLGRLALGRGSRESLAAVRASAEHAAATLDSVLLGEVGDVDELVVVPTGVLHRLPWRALPSLVDRPFVVAPSAAAWSVAADAMAGRDVLSSAVGVAGPGVPSGVDEARRVADLYLAGTALTGSAATVAAVQQSFGIVDVAHVAAHGTFRTDNPLFSSLRMADGPLTVYELELLARVPPVVVLSACDSAVNDVTRGDGLLGLSSALLALGSGSVVGPVIPVPDTEAAELMVRFHRSLGAGRSPDGSLCLAVAEGGGPPDEAPDIPNTWRRWATDRAFVVFGA